MASTKLKSLWTTEISGRETAPDIFDRILLKFAEDAKKKFSRSKYCVREFHSGKSLDINGVEAMSTLFIITSQQIFAFNSMLLDAEKEDKKSKTTKKEKKKVNTLDALFSPDSAKAWTKGLSSNTLKASRKKRSRPPKRTARQIADATYLNYCNSIEIKIGVPNFQSKWKIESDLNFKSSVEIKARLAKFERREKFELKSLREMCPDIKSSQNPSTRAALKILSWLYNNDNGRKQESIIKKLWETLYDREKDKLFYIRRHPGERMLHCCNDDAILETISHLEWMFIGGNPFAVARRSHGALARFI